MSKTSIKKQNIINNFFALSYLDVVNEKKVNTRNTYNISEIYNLAKNLSNLKNNKDLDLILKNKTLSKIFFNFMKMNSVLYMPPSIAASSILEKRNSPECEIVINTSNKNDEIVYIRLSLKKKIEKKVNYLYAGKLNKFTKFKLPNMIDNEVQFMVKKNDLLYDLIIDPNSEIFIR